MINLKVGGGTCAEGGMETDVWTYAYTNGIVDASCLQYTATDWNVTEFGEPGPK